MKLQPVYLVTCPQAHEPGLSRSDDELLQHAFAARGVACQKVVWSEPSVNWERLSTEASAVVVRSAWDYYVDRPRFLTIMETIAARTVLLNQLEVIRWNTHKSYLDDLHRAGMPTIPTLWLQQAMPVDIGVLCAQQGWSTAVLKPAVSTNAHHTLLFTREQSQRAQEHLAACGTSTRMPLQPFFDTVTTVGEQSLVFINGTYSHAFRKQFALGADTQTERPSRPSSEEIGFAERVLKAVATILHLSGPGSLLFARIDLVPDTSGQLHIMEVELTEPQLRLHDEPTAADRLASAIVRAISIKDGTRNRHTRGVQVQQHHSS